nr:MAG TPA: hypothetical protein [Caudoviricetes sp.]
MNNSFGKSGYSSSLNFLQLLANSFTALVKSS